MANWRRWTPILFGVGILLACLAVGGIVVSVAWLREHVVIDEVPPEAIEQSFAEVRGRFTSRDPLIEVRDTGVRRNPPSADAPRASISTLHLLAWDSDDSERVRLDLPFWLFRLKEMPIQFGSYATALGGTGVTLRADEIERYGHGLIVDLDLSGGERALIWAE